MNNIPNQLAIVVNTYSRDESLRNCLKSIETSISNSRVPIIVIHQLGFPKVDNVIQEYSTLVSRVTTVSGLNRTALENINHNRYCGYKVAFEDFRAKWVFAIEEDVVLSKDAFKFVVRMLERYEKNPFFRGINLGSREPRQGSLLLSYSLLRYGMHGQASVIGSRTWRYIQRRKVYRDFSNHGFDWLIERHLKSGFMVTPNLSRSLDTGWDGTHMPGDRNDAYFAEMRESFVGDTHVSSDYVKRDLQHRWRDDVEIYRSYKTPIFLVKNWWKRQKHSLKVYLDSAR